MRAVVLRRSLVFAVCAIGVGCLYLAPNASPSPDDLGSKTPADEPTAQPAGWSSAAIEPTSESGETATSQPTTTQGRLPPAAPSPGEDNRGAEPRPTPATSATEPTTGRAGTARDPQDSDREPPQSVREIKTSTVTPERLGLSWPAARDNVRVVGYHVWLDGFDVASTAETRVSVRWFNDDTTTHVVQVKAVDAAGNESETSPSVLVTRPDPEPSPSPTPTRQPTDTATPTPEPSASREPSGEPSAEAEAAPTPTPTGTPNGAGE